MALLDFENEQSAAEIIRHDPAIRRCVCLLNCIHVILFSREERMNMVLMRYIVAMNGQPPSKEALLNRIYYIGRPTKILKY